LICEIARLAASDENANQATRVNVAIDSDGALTIKDDGRGLPVTPFRWWKHYAKDTPTVEMVFMSTITHHPNRAYHEEVGFVNYLGAVLNVVSERLEVETNVEGKRHRIVFGRGAVIEPLRLVGDSKERGTTIKFKPDRDVFNGFAFDEKILRKELGGAAKISVNEC